MSHSFQGFQPSVKTSMLGIKRLTFIQLSFIHVSSLSDVSLLGTQK